MVREKITYFFNRILKELEVYKYEKQNDIDITDLRDDIIILSEKWSKFLKGDLK